MSATNSSAAVARSQAKRRRSALDSLKRVLPERSAKLTAGLTIVIAMVLFAIIGDSGVASDHRDFCIDAFQGHDDVGHCYFNHCMGWRCPCTAGANIVDAWA